MIIHSSHPRVRKLSFQQLLNQKVADMDLRPKDALRDKMIQLRHELKKHSIEYFPHFYFGEDPWGCIDRTSSIEIPFYLADNKLRRISEEHYSSYTNEEIMMLLRHETGHAINYAYKLWQRNEWKELFGNFRKPYREFYNYNSYSRDYVRYLHHTGHPHYAQKHPDDDFAETFAVWLDPSSRWQTKYRDWEVALQKLRYVDKLFRKEKIAARRPLKMRICDEAGSYRNFDCTVAEYFEIEKKVDPRIMEYTADLMDIFSPASVRTRKLKRADRFIQNYFDYLEGELARWIAGSDRRDIREYLREIQTICALNNLRVHPDKGTEKLVTLVIVATYHVLNRLKRIR